MTQDVTCDVDATLEPEPLGIKQRLARRGPEGQAGVPSPIVGDPEYPPPESGRWGHDKCGINSVALAIGMAAGALALPVWGSHHGGVLCGRNREVGEAMTYCSEH